MLRTKMSNFLPDPFELHYDAPLNSVVQQDHITTRLMASVQRFAAEGVESDRKESEFWRIVV